MNKLNSSILYLFIFISFMYSKEIFTINEEFIVGIALCIAFSFILLSLEAGLRNSTNERFQHVQYQSFGLFLQQIDFRLYFSTALTNFFENEFFITNIMIKKLKNICENYSTLIASTLCFLISYAMDLVTLFIIFESSEFFKHIAKKTLGCFKNIENQATRKGLGSKSCLTFSSGVSSIFVFSNKKNN